MKARYATLFSVVPGRPWAQRKQRTGGKNFAETRGQRMGLKTSVMIHMLSFLLINMCEWKRSCTLTRVRDARRRRGFRKFGNVKKLYTENELKDTRLSCPACLPAFSACLPFLPAWLRTSGGSTPLGTVPLGGVRGVGTSCPRTAHFPSHRGGQESGRHVLSRL